MTPYRRNIPEIGYKPPEKSRKHKRFINALYDSMLNILLKGYVEIIGEKIIPSTGQMMHLLFEMTLLLDEYLDKHRKTNNSLNIKDVLEEPLIKEHRSKFHNYLRLFGREESITSYLKDMFAAHYDHYVRLISTDVGQESFENTMEISQIDSGQSLSSSMEIVRLFNRHQPNQIMLDQFYLLGTVGKFAEDIVDLASDIQKGHLNLFCSLVKQNPDEKANLFRKVEHQPRIDFKWLNKNCHKTFVEYLSFMESFYNQITSPQIRLVCDLSIVPALLGRDFDPERHAAS
jgi:hypothetical protein